MSIRDRIENAELLWSHDRYEGAFLCALSAVAATARLRYPDRKAVKDGEAFKQFLESARSDRLSIEFRGECHSVEHVFYKWLRCELVHEGGLPVDIQFMPDTTPGAFSIRAGGKPEFILKLSYSWFHYLLSAVSRVGWVACCSQPNKTLFLPNTSIQLQRRNTPIDWQNTLPDITVDTAKRRIDWPADHSVFDRIVMDVINMLGKIPFITNSMFPKSPLPDGLLLFMLATGRNNRSLACNDGCRKCAFDIAPTH